MSEEEKKTEPAKEPPAATQGNALDVELQLAFVPTWAKQPASKNPYASYEERGRGRDRGGRRPDKGGARGKPGERPSKDGRGGRPGARPGARQDARPGGRPPSRDQRGNQRPPARRPEPRIEAAEVEVSFLPERDALSTLANELHKAGRAYRLKELAHLFLTRPDYHAVKIETKKSAPKTLRLYQCRLSKRLFMNRADAVNDLCTHGIKTYFAREEVERVAPTGQFVVISRCRLSGTLLGPPNHHSTTLKVQEMHRERYPHMSLDAYRQKIETVRDPDLIEQWKTEQTRDVIYREISAGPEAPELKLTAVLERIKEQYAETEVVEGRRFIVPSRVIRELKDPSLQRAVQQAWARESRRPYTISRALKPALRHSGFHFFRANGQELFVTPLKPHPLAPEQATATIGQDLTYLTEHPGCTRRQLLEGLRPGGDPNDPEVLKLLAPLRWLVEKGHVIEFSDGTLAVPRR